MPDALRVKLSDDDVRAIHGAADFNPMFPLNFLFNYKRNQPYSLRHTAAHQQQYQMTAWVDAPPKQEVSCLSPYLVA